MLTTITNATNRSGSSSSNQRPRRPPPPAIRPLHISFSHGYFTAQDREGYIRRLDDRSLAIPTDAFAPGGMMETEYTTKMCLIRSLSIPNHPFHHQAQSLTFGDLYDAINHTYKQRNIRSSSSSEGDRSGAGCPTTGPAIHKHLTDEMMRANTQKYSHMQTYITRSTFEFYSNKYARYLLRRQISKRDLEQQQDARHGPSSRGVIIFSPVAYTYESASRQEEQKGTAGGIGIGGGRGTEIIVTGTLTKGHSATLRITGFRPYCLFEIPEEWQPDRHPITGALPSMEQTLFLDMRVGMLIECLEDALYKQMDDKDFWKIGKSNQDGKLITSWSVEPHITAKGFQGRRPKMFCKVELIHPCLVRKTKELLAYPFGGKLRGFDDDTPIVVLPWLPEFIRNISEGVSRTEGFNVFEAHVDYIVRFIVDNNLTPNGVWFIGSDYQRDIISPGSQITHSNIEITTDYRNIRTSTRDYATQYEPIFVDLKFDIEAESSDRFPDPKLNPVTIISLCFRFGPIGKVSPDDRSLLVDTPMKDDETVRPGPSLVRFVLSLGSVPASKDYNALSFSREEDLLMCFAEILTVMQPDFVSGHFSNKFDFAYLLARAHTLGLMAFPYFGRIFGRQVTNNANDKKSTKKGLHRPCTEIPGVMVWDSSNYAADFMFVQSRSLNALCASMKLEKIEVAYSLIHTMMQTKEGRGALGDYCFRDAYMTERLDDKESALSFIRAIGNLCNIPGQLVGDRASIFRIIALWLWYCQRYHAQSMPRPGIGDMPRGPPPLPLVAHQKILASLTCLPQNSILDDPNYSPLRYLTPTKRPPRFIPKNDDGGGRSRLSAEEDSSSFAPAVLVDMLDSFDDPSLGGEGRTEGGGGGDGGCDEDGYEGGKVLPPVMGMYLWALIMTLDFQSLYPTIMRRFNLCYMTYIEPGKQEMVCKAFNLDIHKDLWHVPIFVLRGDGHTTTPVIDMKTMPSFVRPHVLKGLTCLIEEQLMAARAATKDRQKMYYNMAKEEEDPIKKAVYIFLAGRLNLQQLAEKIMCNSIYGSFGTSTANFALKHVAETITNIARQALEFTRFHIFRTYRKKLGKPFNALVLYGDTDSVFVMLIDIETSAILDYIRCSSSKKGGGALAAAAADTASLPSILPQAGENLFTEDEIKAFTFAEFFKMRDDCNSYYGEPMNLTVEKVSGATVFYTPKCYVLFKAEGADEDFKFKASGVACVRRGGCKLQRDACRRILEILVIQRDPQFALDYARNVIKQLRLGTVPMEELLMRSTLSKDVTDYDKGTPPPHVHIAKKRMKAGEAPLKAGDRVYFIVVGGHKKSKVFENARTPEDVAHSDIPYNVDYYVTLFQKECRKIFRAVVDPRSFTEKFAFTEEIRKLNYHPNGKELVKKKKNDLKTLQDKEVDSVIMWGKKVDFSKSTRTPSFNDLPEELQVDLPKPQYHWAGYDPNEKLPELDTYESYWIIKEKEEAAKRCEQQQHQRRGEEEGRGGGKYCITMSDLLSDSSSSSGAASSDDGDDTIDAAANDDDDAEQHLELVIEDFMSPEDEDMLLLSDRLPRESNGENISGSSNDDTRAEGQKRYSSPPLSSRFSKKRKRNSSSASSSSSSASLAIFCSAFRPEKKVKIEFEGAVSSQEQDENGIYISRDTLTKEEVAQRRARLITVKKPPVNKTSFFSSFVITKRQCSECNAFVAKSEIQGSICAACFDKIGEQEIKAREETERCHAIRDIEDMVTEYKELYNVCVNCTKRRLNKVRPDIIAKCQEYECSTYWKRSKKLSSLEKGIHKVRAFQEDFSLPGDVIGETHRPLHFE